MNEKITFSEHVTSIEELNTEGMSTNTHVYTLDGRLLRIIKTEDGNSRMSLSDLL